MRRPGLALLCALVLSGPAYAQDQAYEIRLHRPGKAGDRYRVAAVGHDSKVARMSAPGREPRTDREKLSVELDGTATILEVGATGVQKAAVTIGRALRIADGKPGELLPAGTVVTELRRGVTQVFEIGGRPVPAEMKTALALVLSETSADNDDEAFGSAARRRVGERWSVDAARVAFLFSRPDGGKSMPIAARDVTGSTRIARLVTCGAGNCLQIEGSGTIALGDAGFGPEGMKAEKSTLEFAFGGLFPVETARPRLRETGSITIRYRGHRPASSGGAAVTLDATLQTRTTRNLAPLD